MKRLTANEKDILRQALSTVLSAMEKQDSEPEDSMYLYHANVDKFTFGMDKDEFKSFKSGVNKF